VPPGAAHSVPPMHRKTQLVARRGERVAEAAEEQADATKGNEPLAVSGLPAAAMTTERAAMWQVATYERWAADAAEVDVLLSRAILRLVDELKSVAEQARRVRADARDALAEAD
jgi:hypothetical protein